MDTDPFQPGYLIADRFELVRLIHASEGAAVFLASDQKDRASLRTLRVMVALKLIDRSGDDAEVLREQVRREVSRLTSLTHKNLVRVFECIEGSDYQAVSLEYIDGTSLELQLARKKLSHLQLLNIFVQCSAALEALHAQELPHGAISGSKILIAASGNAKLNPFEAPIAPNPAQVVVGDSALQYEVRDPQFAYKKLGFTLAGDVYALALVAFKAIWGVYPGQIQPLGDRLRAALIPKWLKRGEIPQFVELIARTACNEHELPSAAGFHIAIRRVYEDYVIKNPRIIERRERIKNLAKPVVQLGDGAPSAETTFVMGIALYIILLIFLMKIGVSLFHSLH